MILSDCKVCDVESVGGRGGGDYEVQHYFKMVAKLKMAEFVLMCRCIQGKTVYMYD